MVVSWLWPGLKLTRISKITHESAGTFQLMPYPPFLLISSSHSTFMTIALQAWVESHQTYALMSRSHLKPMTVCHLVVGHKHSSVSSWYGWGLLIKCSVVHIQSKTCQCKVSNFISHKEGRFEKRNAMWFIDKLKEVEKCTKLQTTISCSSLFSVYTIKHLKVKEHQNVLPTCYNPYQSNKDL